MSLSPASIPVTSTSQSSQKDLISRVLFKPCYKDDDSDDDDESEQTTDSDSEIENEDESNHNNTNYSLNPKSTMGQYLEELKRVLTNEIRSLNYIKVYRESKTFWIYPPNPFLVRHYSKSPYTSAQDDYIRRVFVWAPHLFYGNNKLPCPACKKDMVNDGWAHNPSARYVCDLYENYYILSYSYKCRTCKSSRLGTSSELLQSMPPHLQSVFPAKFSHRGAFSKDLLSLIPPCIYNGMGPESISSMIAEIHHKRYDQKVVNWNYHLLSMIENPSIFMRRPDLMNVKSFSDFFDTNGYNDLGPKLSCGIT